MESFFNVKTPFEALEIIGKFDPLGDEAVPLEEASGRVPSRDIVSPEDLPGFRRSAMDGYAVQAKSTFGASESLPAVLEITGDVSMGEEPSFQTKRGQAARIATGGMLPRGADAVVMVEYCREIAGDILEVTRPVSPLMNVIGPQEDYSKGSRVIEKGRRLRPQDVGVLAGLGISQIYVYKRPRVALISTGDEIVPVNATPAPGQVRDINRYTLTCFCLKWGGRPFFGGHCRDDMESLGTLIRDALSWADSVWISGGSSVGKRDLTLEVLEHIPDFQLLVHGISISPGKPTIIGTIGACPILGLPGQVTSALVVAEVLLAPLVRRLSGYSDILGREGSQITARLSRNIESANGREDYVRVRLVNQNGQPVAEPVFGKSGLISTLVEGDGVICIDSHTEGLYEGQEVKVLLLGACS